MTKTKKLNLKWVSDTIGDEHKQWTQGSIVTIQAQTGTGKSFFILNKLLKHAMDEKKRILYICNRRNLKRQVKFDVAEIQGIDLTGKTLEEIDKTEEYAYITITSYQKIQEYLLDERYTNKNYQSFEETKYKFYDIVVMDEVQFILQDSTFNNRTVFFFEDFLKKYNQNAITIFVSATMNNIQGVILKLCENASEDNIYSYSTGTDYSYIKTYYLPYSKDNQNIINLVNNDNSGYKWLVFVGSNKVAETMLEKIKDSKLICSDSSEISAKMDREEKENILMNSRFECKCLIATKAIDNGVNIKDDLLTNIVIFTYDPIDFIQMLGRKRIDIDKPQQIDLYISAKTKNSFQCLMNTSITPKNELIDLYKDNPVSFARKYDVDTNKMNCSELFYIDKDSVGVNKWKINSIGLDQHRIQEKLITKILEGFKKDKKGAFVKEQLSWINQEYDNDNWIDDVCNKEYMNDLESYLGDLADNKIKLFGDQQQELKSKFITKELEEMIAKLNGGHKDRGLTINKMKQLFVILDIPFAIDSKVEKSRVILENRDKIYWYISRI